MKKVITLSISILFSLSLFAQNYYATTALIYLDAFNTSLSLNDTHCQSKIYSETESIEEPDYYFEYGIQEKWVREFKYMTINKTKIFCYYINDLKQIDLNPYSSERKSLIKELIESKLKKCVEYIKVVSQHQSLSNAAIDFELQDCSAEILDAIDRSNQEDKLEIIRQEILLDEDEFLGYQKEYLQTKFKIAEKYGMSFSMGWLHNTSSSNLDQYITNSQDAINLGMDIRYNKFNFLMDVSSFGRSRLKQRLNKDMPADLEVFSNQISLNMGYYLYENNFLSIAPYGGFKLISIQEITDNDDFESSNQFSPNAGINFDWNILSMERYTQANPRFFSKYSLFIRTAIEVAYYSIKNSDPSPCINFKINLGFKRLFIKQRPI